ncbi:hypothetical protein [Clostridium tyrobutyricum]|uniref:hypothetical protein n=1 Tax=Clostridium tyrobutyricum TaxID=1519 RepID=UPI00189FA95F|nr:hypothetical protein [Clostridium tyrobutyricum]
MSLDNLGLNTEIELWQSYYTLKNAEKANLKNAKDDLKIAKSSYAVNSTDKDCCKMMRIQLLSNRRISWKER